MKTDNELIAEFMGGVRGDINSDVFDLWFFNGKHEKYLRYNTSWDWLMPVVEKINDLYSKAFPGNEEFVRRILAKEKPLDGPYMNVIALPVSTPIEEVYEKVIEFIKWYNQQTP